MNWVVYAAATVGFMVAAGVAGFALGQAWEQLSTRRWK